MLQQQSAYHYWHLIYVHLLEKEFKLKQGTSVIIGFQKPTVHFDGANKTSFFFLQNSQSVRHVDRILPVSMSILWIQNWVS